MDNSLSKLVDNWEKQQDRQLSIQRLLEVAGIDYESDDDIGKYIDTRCNEASETVMSYELMIMSKITQLKNLKFDRSLNEKYAITIGYNETLQQDLEILGLNYEHLIDNMVISNLSYELNKAINDGKQVIVGSLVSSVTRENGKIKVISNIKINDRV